MKLQIISIRDSKAAAWMNPLFFQTKAQAIRAFGDAINDPQGEFIKHPDDYALYYLGEFDPQDGTLTPVPAPDCLGIGANYLHLER